ncbi:MAG: aminomethyltransferase [Pelagibacteraceae bacterium]|nr:MAG: aminomethyltransferase [Pelagibacteraceae bacterium]
MNNRVYIIEDRALLYIFGEDSKDFLQNLISNDIKKVNEQKSIFSSLFSPQGKFLYEFIIIKYQSGFFIDCEKSQLESLLNQLNIYKLRSKIEIQNLSDNFFVAALSHEKFMSFENAKDIEGCTINFEDDLFLLDPRNKKLGARLISNLKKLPSLFKEKNFINSELKDYYRFSHELGIVPKNLNKLQNKLFGIECNYEELNGIDFKKGCYVGQENTARIKLKNKLSKRLLPVNLLKGKLNIDDSIYHNEIEIGKVLIENEYPFALIKYLDQNFNQKNEFKSKNAILKIKQPDWIKI